MPLKLGSISIGEIYLGSVKLAQIYLGSTLVYQAQQSLPAGYTAIDYLVCTGQQYIDTGLMASANGVYEVRAQQDGSYTNKVNAVLGDGNTKSDSNLGLWMNGGNSGTGYGTQAVFGNGSNSSYYINEARGTYPSLQLRTYRLDVTEGKYYIDDTLTGTVNSVGAFAYSKKLVLGACWRGSTLVGNSNFTGDIYYFKAWEGGKLVRDMVPCLNDENVPGMYDFVGKTFYPSETQVPFGFPTEITIVQSTVNVVGAAGTAITSIDLADSSYTTISPSSGTRSFSASSLPTGVSLTTAGVLSGTPSYGFNKNRTVTVSATGAESKTLTLAFAITSDVQPVTMTVSENPIVVNGTVGTPLSIDLSSYVTVSNATEMHYIVGSGSSLPSGLSLNSSTISGTPTVAGSTSCAMTFMAVGPTIEEGNFNQVSIAVTIQFSIAAQPSPPAGLDEETARHLALIVGDYPVVGTPSDAEDARHKALISE